jgi:creatinine amidohydrolase
MLLTDMIWPDIHALDKNVTAVIPIAAVEQHGHHLPLIGSVAAWEGNTWI